MPVMCVWAPRAAQVELQINDQKIAMQPTAEGWWQVDTPEAVPGTDYAFILDGGKALPDPCSAWQPYGVHGPSRLVDHSAFPWTDRGWQAPPLAASVIYELHIGTFTPEGTFDSAIQRLDELVDLGVTHIEIMPVAQFSGKHGWGYDGVNLFAPHNAYGGPNGLKRLVNACHEKGLAAILDVVYNHLGPEGNYLPQFGPYFTGYHHTAWGQAINLDGPGSDEVRRYLFDNALMWLRDYHFDGLRLDAVHALIDTSAIHFLEELANEVDVLEAGLGRHLVVIAESDLNDPRLIRSPDVGGYGLDAQWSDEFHHALHTVMTGENKGYYADFGSMGELALAFTQPYVYAGRFSPSRGRRHGRSIQNLPGQCFVICTQNHDQVGNRATGERLSHLVSPGLLKIGAALMLTAPYVPLLFMGEEWGAATPFLYFVDHEDQALCQAVREGRRKEFEAFGWQPEQVPDPGDQRTFERSRLNWNERQQPPHAELLDWYKRLIQLRHNEIVLTDGRLDQVRVDCDQEARWFIVQRGPITVVSNFSEQPVFAPFNTEGCQIVLASQEGITLADQGVLLPPESVVIVKRAPNG